MDKKYFSDALSINDNWQAAVIDAARTARAKLGPKRCDLAFVFISQTWNDFNSTEVPALLAKELSPMFTIGCNAAGVIGGRREVEMKPAVSILAMSLPSVRVQGFSLSKSELHKMESAQSLITHLDLYPTDKPKFILFGDPMTCNPEKLVALFNEAYPGLPLVGGLASGPQIRRPSWMILGNEIVEQGVSGLALTGDIEFDVIVAQGCRPIGDPLIVTKAEGNILFELGGRPPLDVLRETLSKCSSNDQRLARHSLFAGLVMNEGQTKYKRGNFLIRNLMGFDQDKGTLTIGAPLRRGQTLQFQLRDAITSDTDLQSLLSNRLDNEIAPQAALLFNCCGRGQGLYGEPDHDVALIQSMSGPLPLAGFFANGEFGPVEGKNYIHGYTSSLVFIR